jgi:hypothetical protein
MGQMTLYLALLSVLKLDKGDHLGNVLMGYRQPIPANLIMLRAPFHRASSDYMARVVGLSSFVAMLAVPVVLVEQLINSLKQKAVHRVLVTGISLGGWVTNLHRTYFNSADRYVPLLAGAALAAGELRQHLLRQIENV